MFQVSRFFSMKISPAIPSSKLVVTSPNDGVELKRLPLTGGLAAQAVLENAAALFNDRSRWLAVEKRLAILHMAATLLENRQAEFALRIATEGGKPLRDARVEVSRAIDGIRIAMDELPKALSEQSIAMNRNEASKNRNAYTVVEPIGVILAISAFNHPLNLLIHQTIPAIAAGCPVLLKPDLRTPLTCLAFCEMLAESGLPEGWVTPLLTSNEDTEKLVGDPRIAFLNFIGSAKVGWMLRSKLAPGVGCTLEHGGAAPVIMHDSADFEVAIKPLLKGGFYHAGQVCVSVQRVFVPKNNAWDFAKKLAEGAEKLFVNDARHEDTDVGPLIQPREVNRVHEWVQEAVETGAELMCGGEKIDERHYKPTVLFNPMPGVRVSREEVFGPVICVYSYETIEEAIARANATDYAFQAAVFAGDSETARKIAGQLAAGAVMINDHTAFRVDWMPFMGYRKSGLGIGGIPYTLHDYLRRKLIVEPVAASG